MSTERGVREGARELTPPGRGAVSVLLVEGPETCARALALAGLDPAAPFPEGSLRRVVLVAGGAAERLALDEALLLRSGEHELELHLHGNPVLVAKVKELLSGPGHPAGAEGLSLEEHALERLARAPSLAGARILLDQAGGALREDLHRLAAADALERSALAEALLRRARLARYAWKPAVCVLAGPANAGKSTLFNALCAVEHAVTSAEPGTTRDPVESRILLGEWPADLVDTAGERSVDGLGAELARIERGALELGRAARSRADLVVWLCPLSGSSPEGAPHGSVVLRSQADRVGPRAAWPEGSFSALADPAGACELLAATFRNALQLPASPWEPGTGVPFEAIHERWIAALLEQPERRERERQLALFLGDRIVRRARR